jgi:hypothetical protein
VAPETLRDDYFFSGSLGGTTTTVLLLDLPGAPSGPGEPGTPGGPAGPGTATGGGDEGVGVTTVFSHALSPNAATSADATIEYFIAISYLSCKSCKRVWVILTYIYV